MDITIIHIVAEKSEGHDNSRKCSETIHSQMPQQPVKSLGPNNFRTDHEIGANMHCHLSNSRECTMRATFDKIAAARKFNNNCKNKTVVEIYSSKIRVIHSFLWIVMKQQNIK